MNFVPREFTVGGVFLPPLLVAAFLAMIAMWFTAMAFNRLHLSRYFFYPPLAYFALLTIYTVLISTFIVPS